jgi:hypothetical protein
VELFVLLVTVLSGVWVKLMWSVGVCDVVGDVVVAVSFSRRQGSQPATRMMRFLWPKLERMNRRQNCDDHNQLQFHSLTPNNRDYALLGHT